MILGILGILLYLTGAIVVYKFTQNLTFHPEAKNHYMVGLGGAAVFCHGINLFSMGLITTRGLDLGVFTVLSLVSWIVALLLVIAALRNPVECLAIIVFPFAAAAIGLRLYSSEHYYLTDQFSNGIQTHILLSIFAYSILSIAAVQSILLYIQDQHLHNKHPIGFINALPPLETMETLLFKMIGLGFVLLSIALVSGIPYLQDIHRQHLTHKIILSSFAWIVFAILLWGRWRFGWRGQTAIRWTLGGFVLLMLAYFGSKIVLELILHRL